MLNLIKTLAIVAAMAAAISISFPAEADAQHYYGLGYYGHGFGHGYGHGYGYGGYGGYGYGGYRGYGYGANRYSNQGAVRIEVNPKDSRDEIEVYVDEAHAGVVDDFDGAFQRLYLPVGKHEIEVRLDGYQTLRLAIFVSPGNTYNIRGRMEPLAAAALQQTGDASPEQAVVRPAAQAARSSSSRATTSATSSATSSAPAASGTKASTRDGYGEDRANYGDRYGSDTSDYGAVRIQVKPNEFRHEAQVYVDGVHAGAVDEFDGAFQRLNLPPGKYEIEVRLDGYRTYQQHIFVSPGNTYEIHHRLSPLGD